MKMGEHGVYYATREEARFLPAYSVEVKDTVAAGDAFAAGVAVGLSEGQTLERSVRLGNASGALAVTKSGAQDAMPRRADVERILADTGG